MKTIKFFSFALIVALAWVSCKNTGAETTTEAGISADSLAILKTTKLDEINKIINAFNEKIATTEAALAAATDEASQTTLSAQLESFKTSAANLQALQGVVNGATSATWDSVSTVIVDSYTQAKMALAGTDSPTTNTVNGTATENK